MNSKSSNNRKKILDAARSLLQTRGLNAMSHRDLAALVEIKSSSVHYYFPTKEDIGIALINEYTEALGTFFAEREMAEPFGNLENFFVLFEETACLGDKICLAAMLASEIQTFGEPLQRAVRKFFVVVENGLAKQVMRLHPARTPEECMRMAQFAFSSLEGSLLVSRVLHQPERVRQASNAIVCMLKAEKSWF